MTNLRERMLEDMKIRNLSERTQESYVECIAAFAKHYGKSPAKLGPEEIRRYQLHLLKDRKYSSSYVNVHVCALRFLYRTTLRCDWPVERMPLCKREIKLPVVLSQSEVARFLGSIRNLKYKAILTTAYAAGLRITEIVRLRIKDIDSERMTIRVNQGKGRKDRDVMLSPRLLTLLREYWKKYHPKDWLFPGKSKDRPITTECVRTVCRKVCKTSGIKKHVTPHTMRHSFATHLLEKDVNLPTIQNLLGHRCLSSTVRYTHIARQNIRATASPLDTLTEF